MITHYILYILNIYICMITDYMYQIYYRVATISRLLKITHLFCRISSLLQGFFAEETYNFQEHHNFKEPTNRSHPIRTYAYDVYQDIGLFCRISSLLLGSFAKETCNFKEPTHRSHSIRIYAYDYGVALVSRIDKIIGFFCKRAL